MGYRNALPTDQQTVALLREIDERLVTLEQRAQIVRRQSTLPFNASDGDEVYYEPPGSTSTWHLVYDANKSGPYKWRFAGGAQISFLQPATYTQGATGTWQDPGDCTLYLPLAGEYVITFATHASCATKTDVYVGISSGTIFHQAGDTIAATSMMTMYQQTRYVGAPTTLHMWHWSSTAVASFYNRLLVALPVAVG